MNAGTVATVKSLIEEDCRLTVSDISTKGGVSYGSVHSILRNQLEDVKGSCALGAEITKKCRKGTTCSRFSVFPTAV